jgi:glycosyltransferase involved in cell wall biosynthesis
VAVDGTPLIGPRTGVGRYVDHLVRALDAGHPQIRLVLTGVTVRGRALLPRDGSWRVVARPFPARLARIGWRRTDFPPAELFAGRHQVFHATNFVLPPSWAARGVVTVHDLAWWSFPETVAPASRALRELVPRAVRRAAVVLVPSRAVGAQLEEHLLVPADRIRVTPLGVDAEWLTARPDPEVTRRLGLPERYVVTVATREPRKNLPFLLRAHRNAVARNPATPGLVLVGAPGWGPAWQQPHPQLVATGYLPEPDLRAVVSGALALAMPSLDEGFGLPVLEAFATGTPVLASDLPVLLEVSGGLAALAAPADLEAWTALLLDPPRADPERLREWARGHSWSRCAELTAEAYAEAASPAGAPPGFGVQATTE